MQKSSPIMLRINPNLKRMSDEAFRSLGLNTHAGINLFLKQMVLYQCLPFDVSLNDVTQGMMTDEKTESLMIKTDPQIKQVCTKMANNAGLTLSHMITMYLVQVIDKNAIPFKIRTNERSE